MNILKTLALASLAFLINNSFADTTKSNNLDLIDKSQAKEKLNTLSLESKVSQEDLENAFDQAVLKESIIKAMNRPGEAKPWYEYKKIFIIPKRIELGRKFYRENHKDLVRAQGYFDTDPAIVSSIIGIETFYGRNMGSFRVLDALYTLGFYYPKREAYFKKEFANFVKLVKQQNWDYNEIKGSYAGAMGMGQFMPYSYLTWAVDFNSDGHIDLFKDKTDVIGSVANYFKEHGYDKNKDTVFKIATPLDENNNPINLDYLLTDGIELKQNIKALRNAKIEIPEKYADTEPCKLIKLETKPGEFTYFVALHNFGVIMRYNRSPLYAMAVHELSEEIKIMPLNEL